MKLFICTLIDIDKKNFKNRHVCVCAWLELEQQQLNFMKISCRDVPIIGSAIGNCLYRLIFSYRLSDRFVYQISSRSDSSCKCKFLGIQLMALPYQNIEVNTYIADAYYYQVLTCIYNLTDGETFNL